MLIALSDADERAYPRVLNGVNTRRITCGLQTRGNAATANLTSVLQGGQITLDVHADVTRTATVTLLDPFHLLGFDADTYQGGALDFTRQLRIVWGINSPLLSQEVRIGVFKGPITSLQRDGGMVEIEAQGREMLGLGRARRTVNYPGGTKRTDVIKAILRDLMGETRLAGIPDLAPRLPDDFTVKPDDQPWKRALKLAQSLSRQLYYDGNGVPLLRDRPQKVAWTFRSGAHGGLTSPLLVTSDLQQVKNCVKVTGNTPKNGGNPPVAVAVAPHNHQLSPWIIGSETAPLYLMEEVTNTNCRTEGECLRHAQDVLSDRLRLVHDAQFNAAPTPHLDPLDLIRAQTATEDVTTPLETFTLPLTLEGDMTVGYADPYRVRKQRRRGHGGKHGGKGKGHHNQHGGYWSPGAG